MDEKKFIPKQNPGDPFASILVGDISSRIEYDKVQRHWTLRGSLKNITATISAPPHTYAIGKYNWTVSNDSSSCADKSPLNEYTIEMKLSVCKNNEFTCDDGTCIDMDRHCDWMPDCKDMSDERARDCEIFSLVKGYSKDIPPVDQSKTPLPPLPVNVSIEVMKILSMDMINVQQSIKLKFEITMEWIESRVTYFHLRKDTLLNTLSEGHIKRLWLPLLRYDNTDNTETTRLGTTREWSTEVLVRRAGEGVRSINAERDSFKGKENYLRMQQTYAHNFHCEYEFHMYPFDTQVRL